MEKDIMKFSPLWVDWEIKKEIGKGSYGRVYRAEKKTFNSKYECAVKHIKVPPGDMDIQQLIANGNISDERSVRPYLTALMSDFIREIEICYSLKGNTNIVSYEDHCVIKRDNNMGYDIFIRMELLESLNYSKQSWDEKEIINLGIDMCTALEVLAKNSIIHRDIKPSNIFTSKNGYKLGDFGESKVLSKINYEMSIRGSYPYMSPEIFHASPNSDLRADIYSLGMVMYRLMNNNRPPFVDAYAPNISGDQLSSSDQRRLHGDNIDMPPCNCHNNLLSEAILKACKYDPNERWQSPTEFKKYLLKIKTGESNDETIGVNRIRRNNASNRSDSAPIGNASEYKFNKNPSQPGNDGSVSNDSANKVMIGIIVVLSAILILVLVMFYGNASGKNNEESSMESYLESSESSVSSVFQESVLVPEKSVTIPEETSVVIPAVQPSVEISQEDSIIETVKMVSYVNMAYENAAADLQQRGLNVGEPKYLYNNDIDAGNVISQSVNAGDDVEKNTLVYLTISREPNFHASVPSHCSQVVHFVSSGSDAIMTFYNFESGSWIKKFFCTATVGKNGVGTDYGEGKKITPKGSFPLGVVLSLNRMTYNMSWQPCTSSTVVVEDVDSPYYNQIKDKSELPANIDADAIGDRLVSGANNAFIFIEHNGNGYSQHNVVKGRCSSITICGCCNPLQPTWGCVDISADNMETLLSFLDSSSNPYIKIE